MGAVVVKGISKSFGDAVALVDVSFEADRGVTLVIGPNGAGKTTTLRCISGEIKPDEGDVEVFGKPPRDSKEKIHMVWDDRRFLRRLSPRRHAELLKLLYPSWNDKIFHEMVKEFEIPLGEKPEEFSAGVRTAFSLALAFASGAEVLLLDEPAHGLDPVKRNLIEKVIGLMGSDRTIVLSTHYLENFESVADRFILMNRGRVIIEDWVDDVKENHRVVGHDRMGPSDEVVAPLEDGVLVKTQKSVGRYPTLVEIALAYLSRDSQIDHIG